MLTKGLQTSSFTKRIYIYVTTAGPNHPKQANSFNLVCFNHTICCFKAGQIITYILHVKKHVQHVILLPWKWSLKLEPVHVATARGKTN